MDPISIALGGLFSWLGSRGGGDSPTTTAEQRALQQEMLNLVRQQRGYMSEMDPLRQSVLRMAMGMLPMRYQTPGDFSLKRVATPDALLRQDVMTTPGERKDTDSGRAAIGRTDLGPRMSGTDAYGRILDKYRNRRLL